MTVHSCHPLYLPDTSLPCPAGAKTQHIEKWPSERVTLLTSGHWCSVLVCVWVLQSQVVPYPVVSAAQTDNSNIIYIFYNIFFFRYSVQFKHTVLEVHFVIQIFMKDNGGNISLKTEIYWVPATVYYHWHHTSIIQFSFFFCTVFTLEPVCVNSLSHTFFFPSSLQKVKWVFFIFLSRRERCLCRSRSVNWNAEPAAPLKHHSADSETDEFAVCQLGQLLHPPPPHPHPQSSREACGNFFAHSQGQTPQGEELRL